jgi:hypothetical protein
LAFLDRSRIFDSGRICSNAQVHGTVRESKKGVVKMPVGTDAKQFKSPSSKLARFFCESRDRWKAKVKTLTEKWRKAHVQMRAAERSREHWKQVAREEKEKRKEAERELAELKKNTPCRFPVASS